MTDLSPFGGSITAQGGFVQFNNERPPLEPGSVSITASGSSVSVVTTSVIPDDEFSLVRNLAIDLTSDIATNLF